MNETVLLILQGISALLVIGLILMQPKGGGVSEMFGGSGGVYRTKRGAERFLHNATIFFSIAFVLLTLAFLYVN